MMHIFLYNYILPYDELFYMNIYIYTCINLEFNIYYIQSFTMIHPLYVMVFPRPFQNKKSEAATQAAILANPLLLLATPSGLGPQQSVYDYFGVAVPWVGSRIGSNQGCLAHGIFFGSREHSDQWVISPTYTVNDRVITCYNPLVLTFY